MHKHTLKRTHTLPPAYTHYAEAANWLERQCGRGQGRTAPALGTACSSAITGVNWNRKQSTLPDTCYRAEETRGGSRGSKAAQRQHLLPGRSCLLARIRLSLQHLLFLTTSCQKFSERQRNWLTNPRLTSCQRRRGGGRGLALVDSMCLPALNALTRPAISVPVPVPAPWVKA